MPTDGIEPYTRRDLQHADASHRPTKAQYDRYLCWSNASGGLAGTMASCTKPRPSRSSIPASTPSSSGSCEDLGDLAEVLGEEDIAGRSRDFARRGLKTLDSLWSEAHGQYFFRDPIGRFLQIEEDEPPPICW